MKTEESGVCVFLSYFNNLMSVIYAYNFTYRRSGSFDSHAKSICYTRTG